MKDSVIAYLTRLTNSEVGDGVRMTVTSVQKAALFAWLKRHGTPFNTTALNSGSFTVAGLLAGDSGADPALAATPDVRLTGQGTHKGFALGIDIEDADQLPEASDYREHEFYRLNFSPAEIAHCIQRPDPKLSFCGLWAAKEAIVKATGGLPDKPALRTIVIEHDRNGRPSFAGGELSITHAKRLCVAVCAVGVPPKPGTSSAQLAPTNQNGAGQRWPNILVLMLAAAAIGVLIGQLFG